MADSKKAVMMMSDEPGEPIEPGDEGGGGDDDDTPAVIPETPTYITGSYVHDYVAACDESVKDRLDDLMARRGIDIPDTDDALRTAQIELFMEAL